MGFDNECIVDIQSLAGEYFCPVCRLLVYPNEALQSLCTHLYCKQCLTYIVGTTRACPYDGYLVTEADSKPLLESNKTLAETIGKVLVRCLYRKSGCTWQGSLSDCTLHCTGCAFGNSPVLCNRCGIQILHREVHQHAHSCPGVQQIQAAQFGNSQVVGAAASTAPNVDNSQATAAVAHHNNLQAGANLQTPAVSAGQWYQQTNKQYYQQHSGPVLNQEHQYVQNLQQHTHSRPPEQAPASVQQLIQLQPQDQTRPQFQTQPYLQGQVLPQLHPVIQAAPGSQSLNQTMVSTHSQAQPSLLPHSLVPTQSHSSYQGHINLEAQPNSYPQTYQQAQVQHTQTPQFQQLPEKLNRPAPHSNQSLRAPVQVVAGPQSYPQQQPNQQTQFGVLPSNMHAAHNGGIQQAVPLVQVQNQYPQKLPNLRSSQSHFPNQNQQLPAQGQYPSFPPTQQPLPHPNSRPAVVSVKHPVMRPVQQSPLQQHLGRPFGGIHQLMHQQSAGMHQQVALQSQSLPQSQPQFTRQHPSSVQPQQSVTNHELQQQPRQPSAGAFRGREEHLGPNYPAAVQVNNQWTENNLSLVSEEKSKDHAGGTAERGEDDVEAKSISGAAEMESLNAENGLRSSDETKVKGTLKSEFNTTTDLEHNSARRGEPVTNQMVEYKSPAILTNSENPVLSEKQTKDSLAVKPSPARETDQSEENMEITNSDRMPTQMQPASIINQSSNNYPVDHGPSTFLQRDAQDREPHNFHTPGQPPSVYGPHSPDIVVGNTPHIPSASSSDREPSRFGLAHPTSVGLYTQGQPLPSHNSKISSNFINPPVGIGLRDERSMPFSEDRLNPIPVDSARHQQLDKNFPRPPHADRVPGPESGGHIPILRPFDGGFGLDVPPMPHGKHRIDSDTGAAPRFLHERPLVLHDNGKGICTSYLGPVMGSGRHIDDPRSSMSEFPGMSSRTNGLSQGGPGERFIGMDATDNKQPHRFGFPSHLHRREFVGLADIRIQRGDLIGPDVEPTHMRKGDHLGRTGLSGHLGGEDQVAFAGFPPSRPGEPGFRSKFSLQRFPDGGPFAGDMEPLVGSLGKRTPISIWWCRICKVDCETVEGLDLHSQSKEHQKRSMDIVAIIKQNAKKHKPLAGFR